MTVDWKPETHPVALFTDVRPVALDAPVEVEVQPPPAEADDRQLALFSDLAVLRRDLELAVLAGDFEAARRLRAVALDTYGAGAAERDFAFVERLDAWLWQQPPAPVLARWQEVDLGLAGRPALRAGVRNAVFRRLLDHHGAAALATERPDLVGPLCAALASIDARGATLARALVRDLLLEGRELDPGGFAHDAAVSDLLGEHHRPAWLACLGALRRLWPAPPTSPAEGRTLSTEPAAPPPPDAAAREFWMCLRLARTAELPEAVVHEARRRMKALNPEMHALYMRSAGAVRS
jgi:hypothetical protein